MVKDICTYPAKAPQVYWSEVCLPSKLIWFVLVLSSVAFYFDVVCHVQLASHMLNSRSHRKLTQLQAATTINDNLTDCRYQLSVVQK